MNNPTFLKVQQGLNELIHAKCHLFLLKLVHFDMIEKLTAGDLLHNDIHVLLSFVSFPHLNYVWVRQEFDNLNFFSQELSFPLCELMLHNLLSGYDL